MYITGETYSQRHFPRDEKCKPDHEVVIYILNANDYSEVVTPTSYAFVGSNGFDTVGFMDKELPAGDYVAYIVNQGPSNVDLTMTVYAG